MTRDYDVAREMDDAYDEEQALGVAFRKFVNTVGGTNDDGEVGVIEATYHALDEIDSLHRRVQELEAENERLNEQLDALGDIGAEKTTKEQKIAAVVRYADQKRDNSNDVMRVTPSEIKGLLDVSRRYSYDLVDSIASEFEWARIRDGRLEPTAKDGGGSRRIKKALEIDFAGVHGEPVPVNKFTTDIPERGVA
ncbi:hypothetical protein [Haloprofundus salilacus]|uniref:hypothetical protein n=1 Tax=Haloprofundus salilacus TaxID=2876190 RepID=UPI001CCC66E8|nr:hypothetical protein [Haloprofundus salilacus]